MLHALLELESWHDVLGQPVAGASWEGFVIENLLAVAKEGYVPYFYRTEDGAEVDLVLERGDASRSPSRSSARPRRTSRRDSAWRARRCVRARPTSYTGHRGMADEGRRERDLACRSHATVGGGALSASTARLSAALADRYRIERELGQGGMATVYLAQDVKRIPQRDSVGAERAAIMRGN